MQGGDSSKDSYFRQDAVWDSCSPREEQRIAATLAFAPAMVERALDVGCGDGRFLHAVSTRARQAVGVDLYLEPLRRLHVAALVGSTTALPFRDSTFDLVSATEVLEHLPRGERARAFSEFRRVTRELILVSVPYRENLSEELCRCGTCGKVFHRYGHLDRFEFSDLSELGGDATLEDAISIVPIQKSRRVRLLYWLKYRLGRAYQWDLSARCTYCGGPAERPRPNIIGRLASVLISEIDRLFPLREDGWLVARYREAKSHPASARPKSQS